MDVGECDMHVHASAEGAADRSLRIMMTDRGEHDASSHVSGAESSRVHGAVERQPGEMHESFAWLACQSASCGHEHESAARAIACGDR